MAPVYIANWLYGVVLFQSQGNFFNTTFSLRKDSGPTPTGTDLRDLAQDWWEHHDTELLACYTNQVNFISVTLRDMSGPTGAEGVYNLPTGTNGTVAADSLPFSCCAVASLRTARVGRSGRGRWYFTGIADTLSVANNLVGSYVNAVASAAGLMASFSGNSTFATTAVVASRTLGQLIPIISVIVDIFVDNQRRRLTGRGS
jgi:hypothetical protein